MLTFPSCAAARAHEGMDQSQDDQMRSHVKKNNISSTSLEGMERPVRSFKSFIKTSPPHPTETEKPLPLTPSPRKDTHAESERIPAISPSAGHLSTSLIRNSSVASWKAPAEWYHDSRSMEPGPLLTPPMTAPRTFSPLIPEPSHGLSDIMNTEPTTRLSPGSAPAGRLLPIYERTNGTSDLGPPGTPPRSPLPATPSFIDRPIENILPPEPQKEINPPGSGSKSATDSGFRARALSPANSDTSSASTNEKAFATMGIKSGSNPQEQKRTDREYLRGKKLRALYKGSPLADDSWEDEEMDDQTRVLSFAQDYHDLLADQYQEMNVRAEEVLSSGGAHQVYEAQFEKSKPKASQRNRDMMPRPLSWRKSSGHTMPRSVSHERKTEQSPEPEKKSKHKRLSSFIPHRLSIVQRPTSPTEPSGNTSAKERRQWRTKHIPKAEVDKVLSEDLRFSKFFPSSKPIKFRNKQKKIPGSKASTVLASPPHPQPTPLMRLPGGLVVVRTHSPSPAPKSDVPSDKSPTSEDPRGSSHFGSDHSGTNSDHRASYHNRHSQNGPAIPIRNPLRTSRGSSQSQQSSSSHALGQTDTPPAPPPPPPVPSSSLHSPPLSPEAWSRLRSHNRTAEHRHRQNFFEKAKEARRRRHTEARQDRLKRSIRVLGPTDPEVVSGYVKPDERFEDEDSDVEGRLPGYMVSTAA